MNDIIKSKKLWAVLAVAIMAALIVGAAAGFYAAPQPGGVQSIHNLFVDLNADGNPDLLLAGSVLWNVPLVLTLTPVALP